LDEERDNHHPVHQLLVDVASRINHDCAATSLVSQELHAVTFSNGCALANPSEHSSASKGQDKLGSPHSKGFAVPGSWMGHESEPDLDLHLGTFIST
jgi:hypothetical protein